MDSLEIQRTVSIHQRGMTMTLQRLKEDIAELASLPVDERIEAINQVMDAIGAIHPHKDPVSIVKWVPAAMVVANTYNPNKVMPPEMRALIESIRRFYYTQPIVVHWDEALQKYVIVDGFHRSLVGTENRDILERNHGYLPVVILDASLEEYIVATLLANEARGVHGTEAEAAIIAMLVNAGWSDTQIQQALRMKDADEILRLKQNTGIPALFKNRSYSRSWVLAPEQEKDDQPENEQQEGQKDLWT